jgi:hypothetical protein
MAEVSYYSYEYDPEPFPAEGEDHLELEAGEQGGEQESPSDIQLPTLDTKDPPERWYGPLTSLSL